MNALRSLFDWPRRPSLAELPLALLQVAASGVLTGPFAAVFLQLIMAPSRVRMDILSRPFFWLFSFCMGAIFALSFYLTCVIPQGYLHLLTETWSPVRTRVVRAAAGAVGGMAGVLLALFSISYLFNFRIDNIHQLNSILMVDAIIGAVLAVVIGAWVQRDLREKLLQAKAAEAQAQSLQAQINPHFFFNTLNTIQSLVDTDPAAAKRVIGRLSKMFRYTLAATEQRRVRATAELEFIGDYLEIEKARFGDRLRFTLPDPAEDFEMPGLLVQPLVENGVRHGVSKRIDGGEVQVRLDQSPTERVWTVWSPFEETPDLRTERIFRPGHALSNIRDRLSLAYDGKATLAIFESGGGVQVMICLPK